MLLVWTEGILLFLTLLLLPTSLGWHFPENFSFIYSKPQEILSPVIYWWDLAVLGLLLVSLFQSRGLTRAAFNILFIFLLTQLLPSLTILIGYNLNIGAGLVKIEQLLVAGLYGLYLSSSPLVAKFLRWRWWWLVLSGYLMVMIAVIPGQARDDGMAWQLFQSSPILGVGLNNFIPAGVEKNLLGPTTLQVSGNMFWLILSETGLVGMLGFIILVSYPVLKLARLLPDHYSLLTLLIIWELFFLFGLTSNFLITSPVGYRLLFLMWGICLCFANNLIIIDS